MLSFIKNIFRESPDMVYPNGITFFLNEEDDLNKFKNLLLFSLGFLEKITKVDSQLYKFEDWLEHDGFSSFIGKTDFSYLKKELESSNMVKFSSMNEDEVRMGITPVDKIWYLRFSIDEEGLMGNFTLSLPSEYASYFRDELNEKLKLSLGEISSYDFKKKCDQFI